MAESKRSLARALDELETLYGRPKQPIPRTPLQWILWENVAYLVDDERRGRAFRTLEARVGLTAEAVAKASRKVLREVAGLGGMHPEQRAVRLKGIGELALEQGGGSLAQVLKLPLPQARKVLMKFPGIGDPGADKILMFAGALPALALDSNGLRVLLRLGYGEEGRSYSSSYRSAIEAIEPHLERDRARLVRAHQLLRTHGRTLCKANAPDCDACPLAPGCGHFARAG